MYFRKISILLVISACIFINAVEAKRKPKIKRTNLQNIVSPKCGCQNSLVDIINCGCRGSAIEPILGALGALEIGVPGCRGPIFESPIEALAPLPVAYHGIRGPVIEPVIGPLSPIEFAYSGCRTPVIDISNYRYADPIELNPLGCLFPSIEIPNYGVLSAPMTLQSVEYFTAVDLPCGCPGPQCGCRAPAVKLPACPIEYVTSIEVPNCGGIPIPGYSYGTIASVIEMPSYGPAPIIQIADGIRGPVVPACGCQRPCSCPSVPVSPCGCKGPCGCAANLGKCGCKGPCGCGGIPVPCGCQGPCSCPGMPAALGVIPAIDISSYGCGCGLPACECGKYLRQVTLQPPFL